MAEGIKTLLECALLAMVPVVELRGALPWGIAHGLPAWQAYGVCVICNMIPVPFILRFMTRILAWMDTRSRLRPASRWIAEHGEKKLKTYRSYQIFGLFLLVAIPLPGTGAWTGALVAALTGLKLKNAFWPIFLGVAAAGAVMLAVSMGAAAVLG